MPSSRLPAFLTSQLIPDKTKRTLLGRIHEFADGASRPALEAVGDYALSNSVSIEWSVLLQMATSGVRSPLIVRLLQRFLSNATLDHLRDVLIALGDRDDAEYAALTVANGRHPKIPETPADRALLERLHTLGTVATYTAKGDTIRVHMKRPS